METTAFTQWLAARSEEAAAFDGGLNRRLARHRRQQREAACSLAAGNTGAGSWLGPILTARLADLLGVTYAAVDTAFRERAD